MKKQFRWLLMFYALSATLVYNIDAHIYPISSSSSYLKFKPSIAYPHADEFPTIPFTDDDNFDFNTIDHSYPTEIEYETPSSFIDTSQHSHQQLHKNFPQFNNKPHQPQQFFSQPSVIPSSGPHEIINDIRHPAVVLASLHEKALPTELQNPFYKNHRIRSALEKTSWFHDGETIALNRHTERIPRTAIYKLLLNAGFLHKNNHHY